MAAPENRSGDQAYRKRATMLSREDIRGENVYEEVWLPIGDERENDIHSLLQQARISKY